MNAWIPKLLVLTTVSALAACSDGAPLESQPAPGLPVTAVEVRLADVEVIERTVGRIEAAVAPVIGAEVPGRIVEVLKDAGDAVVAGDLLARMDDANYRNAVARLQALHEQQLRTVTRMRNLVANDSASQSLLDEAQAQEGALAAQLRDARTALARTRIVAPVDGTIQRRMVSVGDFRGVGDGLFQVSGDGRLRVTLPFPERLSGRIAVGQPVMLQTVGSGEGVSAAISELRPMVGQGSRAMEAIVELDNPGSWRPGSSVSADVVVERREAQLLVPTMAVVQRPTGSVVYVVDGSAARERIIEAGVRQNGEIEIRSGLNQGERVVVDGSGFLTDGARIAVRGRD